MITSLTLTDFRSYAAARLEPGPGATVLFGPNGAGKTNVLEALSLLTPGKGLRGASSADLGRREPGEAQGRPWAVSTLLETLEGEVRIGTGVQGSGASRRVVRIDEQPAPPGRMLEHLRPVWATPEHDRLFSDSRAERMRFFDRLVFAVDPAHAAHVAAYEKALRERLRLLTGEEPADPIWLDALEQRLGEAGARAAEGRVAALEALQAEIDARGDRPFPQADLSLSGEAEAMAGRGEGEAAIAAAIRAGMKASRSRDAGAGRSLFGPHRTDLSALHREKNRPAAEGSSGEQKALVLNLILGQVARLADSPARPILLLDEAPAHLDERRRAALFDEIEALGLQAFLTGTERVLFTPLEGRARFVQVSGGGFTVD
ncbi:DNA replication/repair protein RecF [Brevundimonas sp. 2R-24]|uniref:DNA replication and repair protein RecF n=1 Tax=Peiella sedimenti TaxID=3061083 RepID=A0ABT8SJU9_9CAUL|nr:DNA replication/repair protein RecF [Caulobacteraceae bacterium XZ-24]